MNYLLSTAGVSVNLSTNKAFGGFAQGDTIVGFENLVGSNFADTLTRAGGNSFIHGAGGNDKISGANGADVLEGTVLGRCMQRHRH